MYLQKVILADEAFGLIPCKDKGGGVIYTIQIKIIPKAIESSSTFKKGSIFSCFGDQNRAQAVLPNGHYTLPNRQKCE